LLQLTGSNAAKYGVTNRCDPGENIRGGCAHWSSEAGKLRAWLQKYGYSTDEINFWRLAYLYTAIGGGGTKKLIQSAGTADYDAMMAWVSSAAASGALPQLGTQSPKLVNQRVKNCAMYTKAAIETGGVGGGWLALIALGGLAFYFLYWRKRR